MTTLGIILASARPNRVGAHVLEWVTATLDDRFEVDVIDLKEVALPAFDGLTSPKQGQPKTEQHAIDWGARIESLDALLILTPQYNGAYPGQLKNAIDFLYAEWESLPTFLVGYGWNDANEVLPMLETLMGRVGAEVVGSVGLGFRADLSVDGELFIREEKSAALREGADLLAAKAPAQVG